MPKSPLLESIEHDRPSLGLWVQSPDMVELCAHMGFEWFSIDQMFTGIDWSKAEEMIRTGEAAGITPVLRIQSNPWLGYDHRLAVDVSRAEGIGAQFIHVSYSCKKEVEECISVCGDWHRRALWIHPFDSFDEWEDKIERMKSQTYLIPCIESKGIQELEETLAIPGLKMFFFAMTDLSKVVSEGAKPDWYHPKVWEYVRRAVEIGRERGIVIGANTSYAYDMEELRRRVNKLHEAGVKMIMIQGASFLFQVAIGQFLRRVKGDLGL
jgi:4-hydroxy-2-oxoheptanedioate aldolase